MRLEYFEDTASFFIVIARADHQRSIDVTDTLWVDVDRLDRVTAVESTWALKHLGMNDPKDNPPDFLWVTTPRTYATSRQRLCNGTREFVHDAERDTVYMELAGGEETDTVEILENVRGCITCDGAVAGLMFANASRSLDLRTILSDGPPEIEVVSYRETSAEALATT